MADVVPLLFVHSAYKSYPENWLMEKKWDRLGRWLDTFGIERVPANDFKELAARLLKVLFPRVPYLGAS